MYLSCFLLYSCYTWLLSGRIIKRDNKTKRRDDARDICSNEGNGKQKRKTVYILAYVPNYFFPYTFPSTLAVRLLYINRYWSGQMARYLGGQCSEVCSSSPQLLPPYIPSTPCYSLHAKDTHTHTLQAAGGSSTNTWEQITVTHSTVYVESEDWKLTYERLQHYYPGTVNAGIQQC